MSIESELIKKKSDREMQYQTHGLFKQKRHGNITTEEKKSFKCVNQQRPEFKQENN